MLWLACQASHRLCRSTIHPTAILRNSCPICQSICKLEISKTKARRGFQRLNPSIGPQYTWIHRDRIFDFDVFSDLDHEPNEAPSFGVENTTPFSKGPQFETTLGTKSNILSRWIHVYWPLTNGSTINFLVSAPLFEISSLHFDWGGFLLWVRSTAQGSLLVWVRSRITSFKTPTQGSLSAQSCFTMP